VLSSKRLLKLCKHTRYTPAFLYMSIQPVDDGILIGIFITDNPMDWCTTWLVMLDMVD
jgi:hypothetical protein